MILEQREFDTAATLKLRFELANQTIEATCKFLLGIP